MCGALLVSLALAAQGPTVVFLPLLPERGVSKREAQGIHALVRAALDEADFVKPLPATRADEKQAKKCGLDPKCLSDLAYARGADLLAAGVLVPSEEGFVARVVVVTPKSEVPLREVDEPLLGVRADLEERIDRLLRKAFAPKALAGGVLVVGSPAGAFVLIDGKVAGALPMEAPVLGIVEGEHEVTVRKKGYVPLTKPIVVRFREVTRVDVVLRPDEAAAKPKAEVALPLGPLALGGAGLVAALAAGAFGTGALLIQREVERRAEKQQLFFPRDAELLRRGEILSWVANGLYVTGALLLAGGGGWWLAEEALRPEERVFVLPPPAPGAPGEGEVRPGL